ncbi:MAG: cell division protein FtsL [Acidobacteriota bacterium]|jgi:cell division protein FtsL|nr:cell division protein FtsL [Acidobacteriota bacterium]
MKDWVGGVERRNYGIRGGNGATRDLVRGILLILPVAGVLLLHLWVRNQATLIGYEIRELAERRDELQREQVKLKLEAERLQSPGVIEDLARNQLGMVPLRTGQLLRAPAAAARAGDADMAMAAGQGGR